MRSINVLLEKKYDKELYYLNLKREDEHLKSPSVSINKQL